MLFVQGPQGAQGGQGPPGQLGSKVQLSDTCLTQEHILATCTRFGARTLQTER